MTCQVEHGCHHGKSGDEEQDGRNDSTLMIARNNPKDVKQAHNTHVNPGGDDAAHHPGEEVLILTLKHLTSHELTDEGCDQDGRALDPSSLVEKAESCAGHTRSRCIGETSIEGMPALNLIEFPIEVFHGLMSTKIVHDSPQCLKTINVHPDSTHLAGLGAEPLANERRGDKLRHGDRGLVPIQSYR